MSLKSTEFRHFVVLKKEVISEKDNGDYSRSYTNVGKIWAALRAIPLQSAPMSAIFSKTLDTKKNFFGFFEMNYKSLASLEFDMLEWDGKKFYRTSAQIRTKDVWKCLVAEKQ
jgi:hypothetical protein